MGDGHSVQDKRPIASAVEPADGTKASGETVPISSQQADAIGTIIDYPVVKNDRASFCSEWTTRTGR